MLTTHGHVTPRSAGLSLAGVLLVALLAGCTPQAQPAAPEEPKPAVNGAILFDVAHGEVFGPDDTSPLGHSQTVAAMTDAGYEVRLNKDFITADELEGVPAVYLPGPMRPVTEEEKAALDDYVRRGGTVILSIHVPYPVLGMPAQWGLPVGTQVMQTTKPTEQDPGVWATSEVTSDTVAEGVSDLLVVSGWPVDTAEAPEASSRLVIYANRAVVVDGNGDQRFDGSDPQPPYGVVGVSDIGSGRVIVLGDDAILANIAVGQPGNARLLRNILDTISLPDPV